MVVLTHDLIVGRCLALYGEFSPAEWHVLRQLVRSGATVIEVGANIGAHTIALAKQCAPGPLYAFEPQQRVFQILCANLALNGVGNVFAYPEACGAEEGMAAIPRLNYETQNNFGRVEIAPSGDLPVRVVTIDGLNLSACDLIKIDVEGFERQVLVGASQTIYRHRPVIYIENDRREHQQAVIDILESYGYRQYWHLPPLVADEHQPDVFGYPIVSVNMLCLPRESAMLTDGMEEINPRNWSHPLGPAG